MPLKQLKINTYFNPDMGHEDFVKFVKETRAKQAKQSKSTLKPRSEWESLDKFVWTFEQSTLPPFEPDHATPIEKPFRVCCKAIVEFPLLPLQFWSYPYRKWEKINGVSL